ncbi:MULTISPECIES: GNAT family N-acetyltransferase [Alphaproteobacteria]|uniref:N-acetyltransferase n=2 Tax=Alphaproteobacteria TaxID=28211 RepID=A0A512HJ08_9HYPH|nr:MULTISPECIES: GNAT family protein [Alphaproteobacteria]GEO85425.1 N-acetyltransferase [Ciceribacter naphthalenivorans]GLR21553.1 N-acetyltransferase [Ciceribacter naphthalenivorans]GLT04409.1 N-acetyltransferase [Sphingomonas psychrolutea]
MRDLSTFKGCPTPQPVRLEGRFVTVEPYDKAKHLEALWEGLGGMGINPLLLYFTNYDFSGIEDFEKWLDSVQTNWGWVAHVFRDNKTGKVVGMSSYMRADPANGVVEVGAVAHGPAMSRTPISTEAHYLMARHVFDDLGYRRYEWKCHNENEPSKAAAKRYGFTFEGVFRQHMLSKGKNRDTAWFSMIDGEWPLIGAAFKAWLAPENFGADGQQVRRLEDIRADLAKGATA